MQFINLDDTLAQLQKMQGKIANEFTITAAKANELYNFQKLGNAISLYKSIKDNSNEESQM